MKTQEIRSMHAAELDKAVDEAHQELFNLRFQIATGKIKNYKRVKQVKKDIARIKTVLRESELAAGTE
ncbi:MAG: 50S ribosomal protein L29 [Chloroflexi bacterium]|nr:50S ribosomal protein L29 [Chloroflexota bacterium]